MLDFGLSNAIVLIVASISIPCAIFVLFRQSPGFASWFRGMPFGAPARFIATIRHGIGWRLDAYARYGSLYVKGYIAKQSISLRWLFRRKGRPSGLQEGLIISLTSYPPRFASLALTLRCLLSQTVSADRTILWVTAEDYRLLPASVIDLRDEGLEIRFCRNIRSYKKIIPALLAFPNSYIVTADDDVYYSSMWLEELVEHAGKGTIVCHRAHSVKFDEDGQIEPYDKWGYEAAGKGSLLFPTGVGGVLYGPGSLSPDVLDHEAFMQLCPQADDVWLFWMGRRAGSGYVKTRKHWSEVSWNGTQGAALHLTNVAGKGNDEQIKLMVDRYGLPSRSGELKRRPFNADEMIARIQRMLDTQGILTADECRSIWADGPTNTAPIPLAVSSPATTDMVEAPAEVAGDAAIPAAHS